MPITGKSIRIDPIKKSVFGDNSLDPAWDADKSAIDDVLMGYSQGAYSADQLEEIMANNPHTGTYMRPRMALIDKRKEIFGRHFYNPDPSAIGPQQGPLRPGEQLEPIEPRADVPGAIASFYSKGMTQEAMDLAKTFGMGRREAGGGEITIPKTIHAKYGIYNLEDLKKASPETINNILRDYQPYQTITDAHGNQRVVPRLDARGREFNPKRADQIAKLSDIFEKNRIYAIAPAVNQIAPAIMEFNETGQISGVGYLKNTSKSTFLLTPQGRAIKSAIAVLFNEELRQASGMAVTLPEAERKQIADALSNANSAEDYVNVFQDLILPRLRGMMVNMRTRNKDAYKVIREDQLAYGIDLNDIFGEISYPDLARGPKKPTPKSSGGSSKKDELRELLNAR